MSFLVGLYFSLISHPPIFLYFWYWFIVVRLISLLLTYFLTGGCSCVFVFQTHLHFILDVRAEIKENIGWIFFNSIMTNSVDLNITIKRYVRGKCQKRNISILIDNCLLPEWDNLLKGSNVFTLSCCNSPKQYVNFGDVHSMGSFSQMVQSPDCQSINA